MKVHCLQTGDVQIKSKHQLARYESRPARVFDVLVDNHWSPRLPIGCWIIEHEEGLIVIDTGESSHANDAGYQPWWHPFMQKCERRWVAADEEINVRIQELGFSALKVKWVVMTHMHGDHAGGIRHFPLSDILLSESEAHSALARSGPLQGYLNMYYPQWFEPIRVSYEDGPFASFEKSKSLTRDGKVRIVPTPGHTYGHQSVILDFDDHYVLIAGDASYSEKDMLMGNLDGVAVDEKQHHESTRRMRELCKIKATITQFAHDPLSAYRLYNNIYTVIE